MEAADIHPHVFKEIAILRIQMPRNISGWDYVNKDSTIQNLLWGSLESLRD